MKVYCKKHIQQDYEVIAVCDEDILGKSLGSQKISENFYKGDLIAIPEALDVLKSAKNFNIAGKFIVDACISSEIIVEQGIIFIDDIPIAIKLYI